MTDPRIEPAIENLKRTYVSIGRAAKGSRVYEHEGYTICVTDDGHPVGNFAIIDRCDDLEAKEIALYAGSPKTFHVYVTPEAYTNGSAAILAKKGFRLVHSLQTMWVDSEPERNPVKIDLVEAVSNRREVAEYMADQFFTRRGSDIATGVAEATANSDLGLFEIRLAQDRIGVVMLCETPSTIGIYNLVVAPNLRGKGYGAMALKEIRTKGQNAGLAVTLQCEKSLVQWYMDNHFARFGELFVYVLERS